MKIEKGKTYLVSNMFKKSFVEITFYENSDKTRHFQREVGWRSGSMFITPVTNYEVEELQRAVDEGEDRDPSEQLEGTGFSENEFNETWDGCWEDYETWEEEWQEAFEEMRDAFFDDEELMNEHFDFGSYMEDEHGYYMNETEVWICGPVSVEETDYQMEVDWELYEEENAES